MNEMEKNFNKVRDYIKDESELTFSELPSDFTNQDIVDWINTITSKLFRIQNEIKNLDR